MKLSSAPEGYKAGVDPFGALKGARLLVTGAGGFIGSYLVERLAEIGARVRCLVHYNSRNETGNLKFINKSFLNNLEIVWGDIRDPYFVSEAVKDCRTVFHLAALIAIPYSYRAPHEFLATNIFGTMNILEACRLHGINRLVHTSTSEVYGTARYVPMDELHPIQGQSPYSASKIGADKLVESYYCSYGLPVVTIHPFNTYGPRQSQRALIPAIVAQLLTGKKQLVLGSIDPVRDFTFIEDTVRGFLLAAVIDNLEGETINLGTGKGISVKELVYKLGLLCEVKAQIKSDEQRMRPDKSEVLKLISSNEKAALRLGWKPKIKLDDGLRTVIKFIKNNKRLYFPERYII
jgi:dTDP-glucose 4,6-dehydratase